MIEQNSHPTTSRLGALTKRGDAHRIVGPPASLRVHAGLNAPTHTERRDLLHVSASASVQAPAHVKEQQVPSPRQLLLPRNERRHVTRRTPQFCLVAVPAATPRCCSSWPAAQSGGHGAVRLSGRPGPCFVGAAASARMRHEARAQCSCAVNTAAGRSTRGRPEVARGRRLLERRRFRLDRTRDREEVPVSADDRAVASWVGRWRSSLRVGEARDAVPTHALRHPEQLRMRLRRWGSRARTAARQQVLTRLLGRLERGDCWLIPEFEPRISMLLPMTFGSGKLDTPCERMHLANASAPAYLPCAVRPLLLLVGLAEPQAVIATAQPSTASTTASRRPWPLRVLVIVVVCT